MKEKKSMKARTVKHSQSSDKMMPREDPQVFFKLPAKKMKTGEPLSDQISGSKICTKNYKWKEATEDFPTEPHLRHVDKYYPFAMQGKGLMIDEPMLADTIKVCERKKKILEKRGYRYLIIKKDTQLSELLEEISKWPGPRS